ncbi:hypothetical protein DDI_0804 [Dickeya dianthicola RNS04.9]|nr:hypothetical protein DDI_0804 [Dickeya dianthicola RNS04.9]
MPVRKICQVCMRGDNVLARQTERRILTFSLNHEQKKA